MGSWFGKAVHSCIMMAVSDFYTINSHYKTRIVLHNKDTHGEPMKALSAALDLLEKPKVQAIIGSESIAEAKFLAVLGDEARVPILSLSPTSSNKHPYFLQITQDESTQFKGIVAMAKSFGWKNVSVICEDTDNGRYMATYMTNSFQEKSVSVMYKSLIPTSASYELMQEELHKLSTMQTKIYIVHTSHSLASHLFLNAKYLGMMDAGCKWIITSKTMNFLTSMDSEVINSMEGALGFKTYIPQSRDLHKFTLKWRKEHHANNPVMEIHANAIWAYDAVSALAMAVERKEAGEQILKSNKKDLEITGFTLRDTALLNQLLRVSFPGLSGPFQLMNGRITAEVLEIINIIGKGEQRVGFWRTTDAAFTKKIGKMNSFSNDGLEAIVWPGGITANPTHRMLQVRSSSLIRFGIPVQFRSGSFFQVTYDAQTSKTMVTGFCFDVFKAALQGLPHVLPYQFIPFISDATVGTVL